MTTLSVDQPFDLDDLIAVPFDRAAAIARISTRRLLYWDLTNLVRPSMRRSGLRYTKRLYVFEDMVALLVTARLRQRSYSLQHVRRVVEHLKSRGYDRPLSQLSFATFNNEIYFQHPDGSWEGDLQPDQIVIHQVLQLDKIRDAIRRGIDRQEQDHGRTEKRKGVIGGKTVFAGTRIPVETVTRRLRSGHADRQILASYPDLTQADIDRARQLASV